ncbi:MAG: helix-turn-helix domain-containing protein [Gomphosphaeria aponina SAG 52.96 = DSM 107014]|uniref:Helix-turn-helix domain-containing protein n=1 Tax=Gomphosphaeria aponina SAG 52.96 = DSM 107014 TaxID=1521640 RepID=A0A941GWW8_9CHRO|nr:helix-turn-helix domain-containing protein [Gomphosphaeria aponina SAG 52.96 = DSM 107014]
MEALYLKSQKINRKTICQICRISKTTLSLYLKKSQEGGIEKLKELGYKGQESQLNK